jgi:hypothetical protein
MTPDVATFASLLLAAAVAMVVLAVCWLILPFAVLGVKPLLRQLIAEQQRTNELLSRGEPPAE